MRITWEYSDVKTTCNGVVSDGIRLKISEIETHPEQGLTDYLIGPSDDVWLQCIYVQFVPACNVARSADINNGGIAGNDLTKGWWQGLKNAPVFEI